MPTTRSAAIALATTLASAFTAAVVATAATPAQADDASALTRVAAPAPSATISATQQARNEAAVTRWNKYLSRLDRANVLLPPASALRDPARRLPSGLEPLTRHQQVVPGVAAVLFDGYRLTVLPAETVTVVSEALANLTKPYLDGRSGPNAYDCGRFIRRMWDTAGVDLAGSRPTSQYRVNHLVPVTQKQIGDLVFSGSPTTGFTHVGIHLGGGLVLAADAATGQVAAVPEPTTAISVARPALPAPVISNASVAPPAALRCTIAPTSEPTPTPSPSPTPGPSPTPAPSPSPSPSPTTPPKTTPPTTSALISPVKPGTFRYSAYYGQKGHLWSAGYHTGLDFAAPTGTPVVAPAGGVVRLRSDQTWAGPYFVQIDHGNGIVTWYAHMASATVRTGQTVKAGQTIGTVGSRGNSTGPHLHFEMRTRSSLNPYVNGPDTDPMPYLTGEKAWPAKKVTTAGWGGLLLP